MGTAQLIDSMPTLVFALMGSINDNNETWIDSIYSNEDIAYAARKERYIAHFEKQINALKENARSSAGSHVVWYIAKYELH